MIKIHQFKLLVMRLALARKKDKNTELSAMCDSKSNKDEQMEYKVTISSMPFHCPKLSSSFHARFGQYKSTLELFCSFLSHIRTKYGKIMIRRNSKFQHSSRSFSHNLKV